MFVVKGFCFLHWISCWRECNEKSYLNEDCFHCSLLWACCLTPLPMGFGPLPAVHEKTTVFVFFSQPGHREAAWAARWTLTPFPLCFLQCVVPTTLSRWGVSAFSMTEMTVALKIRWTEIHFLFSTVGVKSTLCFIFCVLFLPGVPFFSIHNCLMMQSLSRDAQNAYLNRPSGFYGHSSAKNKKKKNTNKPHWLAVYQPDSAPWMDEVMNVGLLALATDDVCLRVFFGIANSLLPSPVPKPFTVGGALGCS